MKQRIVLLGPPASGKGTQAELMLARYQFPTASPGAILREERKLGTALGLEAEKMTSRGQLVPDSMVNAVVEGWLARHDSTFVFDGYPRSLGQASALEGFLRARRTPLEIVLALEVDQQTIRDRVARRFMCASCGRIIGIRSRVPESEAKCPSCRGNLTRRSDDTPDSLELRLREYADKTAPLIDYYYSRGLLRSVAATNSPGVVFSSIVSILEEA